jgi:hypothetical protein
MSILVENTLNEIQYAGGINSNKPVVLGSTLAVTGVATFTSAPIFNGGRASVVVTTPLVGATIVLTAANSGTTYIQASTSGTPSFTLPAAASGLDFSFITGSTTNGYTITTGTASVINAKTSASGTAIQSTATTGTIVNTQATAVVGDYLSLICDGTNWWMKGQSGIFAKT